MTVSNIGSTKGSTKAASAKAAGNAQLLGNIMNSHLSNKNGPPASDSQKSADSPASSAKVHPHTNNNNNTSNNLHKQSFLRRRSLSPTQEEDLKLNEPVGDNNYVVRVKPQAVVAAGPLSSFGGAGDAKVHPSSQKTPSLAQATNSVIAANRVHGGGGGRRRSI
jgi:hypothetical protein